jgi:hypothetical protein
MHDDPIALLERELVGAARRRAVVTDEREGSSQEPRGPWLSVPRPARRRSSLGAFAAVVLSGLALVVALGALVSLHGRGRGASSNGPSAVTKSSPRQQLIDVLGILRRPQTPADRPQGILSQLSQTALPAWLGGPDLPLVRYATTTPWGEKLYFVPIEPATPAELESFARRQRLPEPQVAALAGRRGETLGVFSTGGGGGAGDAAAIEAGHGIGTSGGGGIRGTRVTLVVPDGVARVKFVLPRQPNPLQYGAPIYPHSLTVTAPVHGNVAAVQLPRTIPEGPFPMIWYAADGHLIKRIGNLAGVNRVFPTPRPGPETALSRAAERDPSTPNRVWVTPSVGGPQTAFKVHFQVLLNGAGYEYRLTGTRCPGITVNGGDGGGTEDLRGRTWSDVVNAVGGQTWCPGTYHLSVTIMGRRLARPFGTTTFTVKR